MNTKKTKKPEIYSTQKMPIGRGLRYLFEAIIAYIIYIFFWLLPVNIASNFGGWIGRRFGSKLGVSRKAYKNITLALSEKTEEEIQKIILGMWDNLGRVIAEYPHLKKIARQTEIVNKDLLDNVISSNNPAIILSGHIANWEMLAASAKQQCNMDVTITYRKLNNPWVDKLLQYSRRIGATGYIHKSRKSILEMKHVIENGGILGILGDQKLSEGIAVDFFGHKAMTMPVPAQLALRFDCPVYPVRIERLDGVKFRMTIFPHLEISKTGNNEQDVQKFISDFHEILESWIKDRPEQWLWIHNRWISK